MATLALGAAGAALGGAFLPGLSIFGATISGGAMGQLAGTLAGSFIDQALFGGSGQSRVVQGPRLASLHVMASAEDADIPRLYGRARLGGQVIWATNFEEVASTSSAGSGKGLGGGLVRPPQRSRTPISRVSRSGFARAGSLVSAEFGPTATSST
jgi:hypothetical protein